MDFLTSKFRNRWEAFQEMVVHTLTHRYFIPFKESSQISLHFKVNLLASEASLKRTQNCKSNEFIKKVQEISESEVDSK